jgi:hypothetical protein
LEICAARALVWALELLELVELELGGGAVSF